MDRAWNAAGHCHSSSVSHQPIHHSLFTIHGRTQMYSVNYHRAISVTEAVNRMKGTDGKFLSGGMTLIPAMKTRLASPSEVVDLAHITELRGIKVANGTVTIGAITTHSEVATDATLKGAVPAV